MVSAVIDFRELYGRHEGPYALVITRASSKKVWNETLIGPYSAEEAHARATALVGASTENVTEVFPYSNEEGQYVGAFYRRGEEYAPWAEGAGRLAPEPEEATPLLPAAEAPTPAPTKPKLSRMAHTKGAKLQVVADARWPTNPAALMIRAALEARGTATVAELVADVREAILAQHQVAHPAALISRLKQAGCIKESVV